MKNNITIFFFLLFSINLIGQEYEISGKVTRPNGTPLESVRLELRSMSGGSQFTYTATDGSYTFQAVPTGDFTMLIGRDGSQDVFSTEGISVLDHVLIHSHLLRINILDDFYELRAADFNRSGTITTMDLVQMRQLILNPTMPSQNLAWEYFREEEDLIMSAGSIFTVAANIDNFDFIGVQLGNIRDF